MSKPLISLADAKRLLRSPALNTQLIGVASDYYNDSVLQTYQGATTVAGFTFIKTEAIEAEIDGIWTLKPTSELQALLVQKNVSPGQDRHILLFDTITVSCGTKTSRFDASARLYAVLKSFGFQKVSIIFDDAIDAKLPIQLTQELPTQQPAAPDLSPKPWPTKNPDIFTHYEAVKQLVENAATKYFLLDARSKEEYAGAVTGYDYVKTAGKIPTAINIINGDFQLSQDEGIESVLARLQSALDQAGIGRDDRIVWYCGTAWRASRMFALTLALGYSHVSIYDGGWNEWQATAKQAMTPA